MFSFFHRNVKHVPGSN